MTFVQSIAFFFFSSRRRHTRSLRDWSSDVCSSDLGADGCADGASGCVDAGSDGCGAGVCCAPAGAAINDNVETTIATAYDRMDIGIYLPGRDRSRRPCPRRTMLTAAQVTANVGTAAAGQQ